MLDRRTKRAEVDPIERTLLDLEHEMGIAHRDGAPALDERGKASPRLLGHAAAAKPRDRLAEQTLRWIDPAPRDRHPPALEDRSSHVDLDLRPTWLVRDDGCGHDARADPHAQASARRRRREPLLHREEHRAAQPVPAHAALRAVGVPHPHAKVRLGRGPRRVHRDQPVASHAEVPVGEGDREPRGVLPPEVLAAQEHVVVPAAVDPSEGERAVARVAWRRLVGHEVDATSLLARPDARHAAVSRTNSTPTTIASMSIADHLISATCRSIGRRRMG